MVYNVVPLRSIDVGATPPQLLERGERWMRLSDALAWGELNTDYVRDGIGPRVRGMVYRGGYYNTVNTVHEVFVLVKVAGPGVRPFRIAVDWEIVEESTDDNGRVCRHRTSWPYDRNQVLFMAVPEGGAMDVTSGSRERLSTA